MANAPRSVHPAKDAVHEKQWNKKVPILTCGSGHRGRGPFYGIDGSKVQ